MGSRVITLLSCKWQSIAVDGPRISARARCNCAKCNCAKFNCAKCNCAKCNCAKCNCARCNCVKCNCAKCNYARCNYAKCNFVKCNCTKCNCTKCNCAKCRKSVQRCNCGRIMDCLAGGNPERFIAVQGVRLQIGSVLTGEFFTHHTLCKVLKLLQASEATKQKAAKEKCFVFCCLEHQLQL